MKNSGVEWIGEIPEDWEVKPVKRYFSHVKRIVGDDVDKYERLSLTMQGVLKRSKDDAEGLQPEKFNGYQILKQNELVFKLIDLENVNTSRVGISPFNGLVSPAYIILSNNKKDNTFYYYWFLNMYYQEIFNKLGDGGVRSALNASDVLSLPMVYLNNETQQRIASYLDKKCNKIEETIQNQQQVIEKLKAYKQSLITEAVTGKVKIENGKACGEYESYKDSGVEWIGKIPSEWDKIRIKWLLNERKERSEEGKEEPLSMSQKYGLIPTKEMETIPNMASTFVGAKLTYKDDIVFNKLKAHLGVFSVSKYDGLVSPDYAVYTSTGKADLKYLEYLFKTPQCISEFKKRSTGVGEGLTRLYTGELFSIYIPFPEKKTQKNIANFLVSISTAIDTAIEQKQKLIEKLTEYKKSLIYECVTGKKEI